MKKIMGISLAFLVTLMLFSGCALVTPLPSAVYGNMQGGLSVDNNVRPLKEGRACAKTVMMIATWGDASIKAAKKDGKIKKVATVDYDTFNILVYGEYCTVVRGE